MELTELSIIRAIARQPAKFGEGRYRVRLTATAYNTLSIREAVNDRGLHALHM